MKTKWILPLAVLILYLPSPMQAVAYKDLERNIPFEDIAELRVKIELGVADLSVEQTQGNNLLEARIHYKAKRGEPRINFERSGDIGYLTIKSKDAGKNHNFIGISGDEERWELRFSPKVRVSFDMDLGLVDGNLDMSGLRVIELSISGGLSNLDLYFNRLNHEELAKLNIEVGLGKFNGHSLGNANFHRLQLETGLGKAKLDLSGKWRIPQADMKVEVGLGSARLEVPEEIAVEVSSEDNFLSSLKLDRNIQEVQKGLYRTANWQEADYRLSIDAEVGLGSLKINIVD